MHLHHEERRTYTREPEELLCECLSVERQEIDEAIEAIDATTVGEVRRECAAGGGCGSCHEEIARMILSRRFGEALEFNEPHGDHEITTSESAIDSELAAAIEQFLDDTINPGSAPLGVTARIIEIGEEVVMELAEASEEFKYTLSFWIDNEFTKRFSRAVTV